MCSIARIINFRQKEDFISLLNPMLQAMRHRGPDATGFYTSDEAGLAHARFSIIDLNGGHQPMHNEDRIIWIVFNGEIFNYPELREELVRKGHIFFTQSDTEFIIHLYEEHGTGLFEHLNGQFAIAIWDQNRDTPCCWAATAWASGPSFIMKPRDVCILHRKSRNCSPIRA